MACHGLAQAEILALDWVDYNLLSDTVVAMFDICMRIKCLSIFNLAHNKYHIVYIIYIWYYMVNVRPCLIWFVFQKVNQNYAFLNKIINHAWKLNSASNTILPAHLERGRYIFMRVTSYERHCVTCHRNSIVSSTIYSRWQLRNHQIPTLLDFCGRWRYTLYFVIQIKYTKSSILDIFRASMQLQYRLTWSRIVNDITIDRNNNRVIS